LQIELCFHDKQRAHGGLTTPAEGNQHGGQATGIELTHSPLPFAMVEDKWQSLRVSHRFRLWPSVWPFVGSWDEPSQVNAVVKQAQDIDMLIFVRTLG
jgi:hypothetical protein